MEIYSADIEIDFCSNSNFYGNSYNGQWNGYEVNNISTLKANTPDSRVAYRVNHTIKHSEKFSWPGLGNFILGLGEVAVGVVITPFCPSVGPNLVGIGIDTVINSIVDNHKANSTPKQNQQYSLI